MHRAWALLLCGYLLGWVPLTFANEILGTFPSLGMRGMPAILELAAHALVAIVCATAGWMVWMRAPAAWPMAAVSVAASSVASIQSLFWTALPRNIAPGEQLPLAALAFVLAVFWLAFIRRAMHRGVS
jgi:hypothetical protein